MKKLQIGINGMGRIGRLFLRLGFEQVSIRALNGRSSVETLAHLLKYDSIYGVWDKDVRVESGKLCIQDQKIPYFQKASPGDIPWDKAGVDTVVECSGAFKKEQDLSQHLSASVKKVLISAPAEGANITLVYGVNHKLYKPSEHNFISLASCTTNCLAPVVQVLHNNFKIERASMTTVHAYTKDQVVLDSSHKDLRRARACATNIIPTSTGAGKVMGKIFPELEGKIQGSALRVPVSYVSLVDLTAQVKTATNSKKVCEAFVQASKKELNTILAVEENPLVSSDFKGRLESSIVDLPCVEVVEDHLIRVVSWYDNEAGFSQRLVDFLKYMQAL